MNTTDVRVVLDTNIFITVLGRKSPNRWIFDKILSGTLTLCISNEILSEYAEILELKTSSEVADNTVNFLTVFPFVEKVDIFFNFRLIPDEDDNKFVDCAISANAFCLVSNDTDFQVLKSISFPKVHLLTLAEFEAQFKS